MKLQVILFFSSFFMITNSTKSQTAERIEDPDMMYFQIDSLTNQLNASGRPWLPFMKGKNVLTGLYNLKAGTEDKQRPHNTDEVYYVVSGKAKFEVKGVTTNVSAGSILFVKAGVEHHFFDIVEDIRLLVFFDVKSSE